MTIVSISLNEKSLHALDKLLNDKGFVGRSEVIRTALRLLEAEEKEKDTLKGITNAVLLVKHDEKYAEEILAIRHEHQTLIETHLHTHLENHSCLELFVLKGKAEQIRKLANDLETSKRTELVKLVVT